MQSYESILAQCTVEDETFSQPAPQHQPDTENLDLAVWRAIGGGTKNVFEYLPVGTYAYDKPNDSPWICTNTSKSEQWQPTTNWAQLHQ